MKDKKFKKTRNLQIFHDNQVLLNKMMVIEQKESQLHPHKLQRTLVDLKQDNVGKRMKDFNKINHQNQFLLKRLQSAKSEYSKETWVKGMSKQMALKRNLKTGRTYSHIASLGPPVRLQPGGGEDREQRTLPGPHPGPPSQTLLPAHPPLRTL